MEGKLDVQTLQQSILSKLGKQNDGVIVSSLVGIDASAYEFSKGENIAKNYYKTKEECFTICKSDPITFPTSNPGRFAIVINLNDLACLGAVGFGVLVTWLLPVSTKPEEIEQLQTQLHETAVEFGLTILGGHTEFTSAVTRTIVSLSMIGFTPKSYFPPRKLKPGDKVYLLGKVGNEGTAILGHELLNIGNVSMEFKQKLTQIEEFERDLSIYNDALKINKKYRPKLMHDPTEGGLLGAIYEMMTVQETGIKLYSEKITVANLTQDICELLQLNPLRLISSGTLLICTEHELLFNSGELDHSLVEIGIITKEKDLLLDSQVISPPEGDQLITGFKNLQEL